MYSLHSCPKLRQINLENVEVIRNYGLRMSLDGVELNLPKLMSLGQMAFDQSGITKIISLGETTSIPDKPDRLYAGVFSKSTVTYANLGDKITFIGSYAFLGCESLKTVKIGSACTTINDAAFADCSAMTEFIITAITPPTFSGIHFRNHHNDFRIYVPSESVAEYQAADIWSTYSGRIKPINIVDSLPNIANVFYTDLYKVGDVYWKAEKVDEVLTWVEI